MFQWGLKIFLHIYIHLNTTPHIPLPSPPPTHSTQMGKQTNPGKIISVNFVCIVHMLFCVYFIW